MYRTGTWAAAQAARVVSQGTGACPPSQRSPLQLLVQSPEDALGLQWRSRGGQGAITTARWAWCSRSAHAPGIPCARGAGSAPVTSSPLRKGWRAVGGDDEGGKWCKGRDSGTSRCEYTGLLHKSVPRCRSDPSASRRHLPSSPKHTFRMWYRVYRSLRCSIRGAFGATSKYPCQNAALNPAGSWCGAWRIECGASPGWVAPTSVPPSQTCKRARVSHLHTSSCPTPPLHGRSKWPGQR